MAAKKPGADTPKSDTKPPVSDSATPPAGATPAASDGQPPTAPEEKAPTPPESKPPEEKAPTPPESKSLEACAGVLELRGTTARDMFGSFMLAVAGRTPSMHWSAAAIAAEAEKLTAEWDARKGNFSDE